MDTPPTGQDAASEMKPQPSTQSSWDPKSREGDLPVTKGPRAEVDPIWSDPVRAMREFLNIFENQGAAAVQLVKDSLYPRPVDPAPAPAVTVVRAKFRVGDISPSMGTNDLSDGASISLQPVYSGSKENEAFFKQTPGGQIQIATVNPTAAKFFEIGQEYYVDFTRAVATLP